MPALPGAHQIFSTRGLWLNFHAKACSRPPPPIRSIFIQPLSFHASEHADSHRIIRKAKTRNVQRNVTAIEWQVGIVEWPF
jgi:hypothetical protein